MPVALRPPGEVLWVAVTSPVLLTESYCHFKQALPLRRLVRALVAFSTRPTEIKVLSEEPQKWIQMYEGT